MESKFIVDKSLSLDENKNSLKDTVSKLDSPASNSLKNFMDKKISSADDMKGLTSVANDCTNMVTKLNENPGSVFNPDLGRVVTIQELADLMKSIHEKEKELNDKLAEIDEENKDEIDRLNKEIKKLKGGRDSASNLITEVICERTKEVAGVVKGLTSGDPNQMIDAIATTVGGVLSAIVDALSIVPDIYSWVSEGCLTAYSKMKNIADKIDSGQISELTEDDFYFEPLDTDFEMNAEKATKDDAEEVILEEVDKEFQEVGEITDWDSAFKYGKAKLKQIHGMKYDERKAMEVLNGLKDKYPDNPMVVIGALKYGHRRKEETNSVYRNSKVENLVSKYKSGRTCRRFNSTVRNIASDLGLRLEIPSHVNSVSDFVDFSATNSGVNDELFMVIDGIYNINSNMSDRKVRSVNSGLPTKDMQVADKYAAKASNDNYVDILKKIAKELNENFDIRKSFESPYEFREWLATNPRISDRMFMVVDYVLGAVTGMKMGIRQSTNSKSGMKIKKSNSRRFNSDAYSNFIVGYYLKSDNKTYVELTNESKEDILDGIDKNPDVTLIDMQGFIEGDDSSYNNAYKKVNESVDAFKYDKRLNSRRHNSDYTFKPKNSIDLKDFIYEYCNEHGWDSDLNFIDVSNITNMTNLFGKSEFNGDISKWDVSRVTTMSFMFSDSNFNGDISKWNVSKVTDMSYMFESSSFNGDISNWDVSKVTDMSGMFKSSSFYGDISKWNVGNVTNMSYMFELSNFTGDISNWNVSKVTNMSCMFKSSSFNGDISKWNVGKVIYMKEMFYRSRFAGNISNWNVNESTNMTSMFKHSKCPIPSWYRGSNSRIYKLNSRKSNSSLPKSILDALKKTGLKFEFIDNLEDIKGYTFWYNGLCFGAFYGLSLYEVILVNYGPEGDGIEDSMSGKFANAISVNAKDIKTAILTLQESYVRNIK